MVQACKIVTLQLRHCTAPYPHNEDDAPLTTRPITSTLLNNEDSRLGDSHKGKLVRGPSPRNSVRGFPSPFSPLLIISLCDVIYSTVYQSDIRRTVGALCNCGQLQVQVRTLESYDSEIFRLWAHGGFSNET